MTTLQKTLIAGVIVATAGTGIYEARQASILRGQVQTLQQQQAPLAEQVQQLELERNTATNRLSLLEAAAGRADNNAAELLRLRSEVGTLRQRTNELGKPLQAREGVAGRNSSPSNASLDSSGRTNFPRDSWSFAGFATPEDALQSYMWAKSRGDVKTAFTAATPELAQAIKDHYFKDRSDDEISALMKDSAANQTGVQILKRMAAADDQIIFQVHIEGTPDKSYALLTMKQMNGEWKVSSAEERADGN